MRSFDETLELMKIELEQSEGTLLLVGICDDTDLRAHTIKELKNRLSPNISLRDFHYDPEHLSLLEAAVETLQSRNGRVALSITGLEDLPHDKWSEAIKLLNLQRNRFGYTGAAVILWVNRAALAEISTKAADFFSWRSGTFIIEPPPGWDTLTSARKSYLHAVVAQNEFVNLQGLAPTRGGQIVQMRMDDIFIPLQVEQEEKSTSTPLIRVRFSFGGHGVEVDVTRDARGEFVASTDTEEYTASLVSASAGPGAVPDVVTVKGKEGSQSVVLNLREEYSLRSPLRDSNPRPVEIADLLKERRAVVLGDPGAGKTTLLRYLAYTLAHAQLNQQKRDFIEHLPELGSCLPVYIRISEYAQHCRFHPATTLEAFALVSCQTRQLPLTEELFAHELQQHAIVLLLDGLDEIIETGQRREIARRLEEFVRAHPQCRGIVTSRIVGYREARLNADFASFTIRAFSVEEIRLFAERWYQALHESPASAEVLTQAIHDNPSVRRLAANPLLLTVIALIHWRGAKLPHHRAKLYSQAAETLVDQWMTHRRVNPEGWDVQETLQLLLPAIAWRLHTTTASGLIGEHALHDLLVETLQRHDSYLSEEEAHRRAAQFRRNASEFSGIFLERGRGLYGFLHLTFEEYFAAVSLADKWEREGKTALTPLLHDPRWTEVLLLTAGHLSDTSQFRATKFVKDILSARSQYENILHRDLLLAARCLADDVRIDTATRRGLVEKLVKLALDQRSPDALRKDLQRIFARFAGVVAAQDAAQALLRSLTDPDEGVRRAAAQTFGRLGASAASGEVVQALLRSLTDPDRGVRRAAAQTFGQLGASAASGEVVRALLRSLTDPDEDVRRAAVETLQTLSNSVRLKDWPEAPAEFVPLARSRNEEEREVGYVCLRNLLAGGREAAVET